MLRGDVRLVDFEPARESEVTGQRRPAVIVSNDGANRSAARHGRGVVTVVPLTTNVERVYPFQVLLPASECNLPRDSKAQTEQIRAVAVERLERRIGMLPPPFMRRLDDALRLHLDV